MRITTRAATAAGFALTLMLSFNCSSVGAQQATTAGFTNQAPAASANQTPARSTYQTPSTATATMTDTPAAPALQGATCGTIGPQPEESGMFITAVDTSSSKAAMISGDALMAGKFDGGLFLRNFSSDIDQFKGKLAEKAFSFIESLQTNGRKEATVVAPGGYTVIKQPATVSPVVY